MEIVLKRPIEELTPKLIEFNNEELMRQAKAYLSKYENIIYDDNSIAEAKETRATLNKIASELNKFSISTRRVYEAPSKHFKSQIDEVISEFERVSAKIGESINAFTERQKAEKKEEIQKIYEIVFGSWVDLVPLDKIYNSKWENKSYKIETVKEDIEAWLTRVKQDIEAIYNMKGVDEIALKYIYLKSLNLSVALNEYNREMESKAFLKEKEEEKKASIIDWNKNYESAVTNEPTPLKEATSNTRVFRFSVELTNEQAKALKQFFVENNIKYEKI